MARQGARLRAGTRLSWALQVLALPENLPPEVQAGSDLAHTRTQVLIDRGSRSAPLQTLLAAAYLLGVEDLCVVMGKDDTLEI
jgi:hypothetical protein